MKVALLSPIAWRTPPRHYGPWERVVSLLCEGLVERGVDVTLYATGDSLTAAKLEYVSKTSYEEDKSLNPKVWEALHIAHFFEQAEQYDLIHNNFDFLPLTYSRLVNTPMVSTIHGFSSPQILPVYKRYADRSYYVSISDADRSPELPYLDTVYHGIDIESFDFSAESGDYLLYFGRIHPDKGACEAIEIARRFQMRLVMAGIIQDEGYYRERVAPHIDGERVVYAGSVGPEKRNLLLRGAYALLHPINFEEPFGLSVVEAMACGTPVVAFNRGSMPEVLRDQETGFLVGDIEQAVQALHRIPELDRAACRRWVESRFSRERMADDYLRLYGIILEKEKPRMLQANTPWGRWEVLLDAPDHKVKRITVNPGRRLSYQKHSQRQEHWFVVSGEALVTLDGEDIRLSAGQSADIPREAAHRMANSGETPLVFIETQTGSYFGEDDIVRLEDDYGRA